MTNSLAIIVATLATFTMFGATLYLDHKVKALTDTSKWSGREMTMVALASLLTIAMIVFLGMGYTVAIGTLYAATMSYVVGMTVSKTAAYAFGFMALVMHLMANLRRERRLKALEAAVAKGVSK